MGAWNFSNLHRDASLVPNLEHYVNKDALGGLLFGCMLLSLCYPVFHQLYCRMSEVYQQDLPTHQRVVVIQHSIEALFFTLCFFPMTYLLASFNFQDQTVEEMGPKATMASVFLGLVVVLYCLEIASRISPRPLLVVHHGLTVAMGVYCVACFTEANITTASLLVYFISFEAVIFVGLILYRLWPNHSLTSRVLWAGMVIFGATRPLQVLAVLGSLLVNRDHVIRWQAVFDSLVTLGFTLLQVYSLRIHYGIYLRSRTLPHSPRYYDSIESSSDGLNRLSAC